MSVTTPPSVDTLPAAPDPGNRSTFNTLAYPWSAALPTFSTQLQALANNVALNATDAYTSATSAAAQAALATTQANNAAASAAAAATASGAAEWVSGNTYALNACAISQIDYQTYRKKTASSVTTIDPSADATNWVKVAGATFGVGGTTATGNVTLTASSPAAMTITPATPGLYITLPDATTCTKADNLFAIYNAGDYDYGVKDSTGTQLGWIRARTGAMIGLADNATASGVWAYYGLEKLGITASWANSTLTQMSSSVDSIKAIALDANRTCFLFGGVDCYAIVYDASTQTWGSATLVRSGVGSGAFLGVLSATNQVLVVSNDSTTAMEAVTLTIATNTITVNSGTKATATLAGNWSSYGQLIAVNTSWVVSYGRSTTSAIRALTVSGTTPTIGSESALSSGNTTAGALFASGSIVRSVSANTSAIYAKPFTVSGSTLSAGTEASSATTSATFRAFLNGNGNIVCHYINTTHYATIFKLTGTVEAASSVSLGTALTTITTQSDYVQVSASKTAFTWHASGGTTWYANVLTDTAGTATAGTAISSSSFSAAINNATAFGSSGNMAYFAVLGNTSACVEALTIDCSGASPVLSKTVHSVFAASSFNLPTPSDKYGVRISRAFTVGNCLRGLWVGSGNSFDLVISPGGISRAVHAMSNSVFTSAIGVSESSSKSTFGGSLDNNTTGFAIQRIEAAA